MGKRDYDISAMLSLLAEKKKKGGEFVTCWIEDVHSIPGDGHVGAFSFGRGVGIWHGLLVAVGIPFRRVLPATWKKHFGVYGIASSSIRKEASRETAKELFPTLAHKLNLKKHHDRAEALLIGKYGSETHTRSK